MKKDIITVEDIIFNPEFLLSIPVIDMKVIKRILTIRKILNKYEYNNR